MARFGSFNTQFRASLKVFHVGLHRFTTGSHEKEVTVTWLEVRSNYHVTLYDSKQLWNTKIITYNGSLLWIDEIGSFLALWWLKLNHAKRHIHATSCGIKSVFSLRSFRTKSCHLFAYHCSLACHVQGTLVKWFISGIAFNFLVLPM